MLSILVKAKIVSTKEAAKRKIKATKEQEHKARVDAKAKAEEHKVKTAKPATSAPKHVVAEQAAPAVDKRRKKQLVLKIT